MMQVSFRLDALSSPFIAVAAPTASPLWFDATRFEVTELNEVPWLAHGHPSG